jgi:dihydrofolate reductase
MLTYLMNVSADGFTADRDGGIAFADPDDDVFRFHLDRVAELDMYFCGRRLYEAMLVWETDPALREAELSAAFAEVWSALPKVVFSRTLDHVDGNARLAEGSLADEAAAAVGSTDKVAAIGGPGLAAEAVRLGLVDEFRVVRHPVVIGGGTPYFPPVADLIALKLMETTVLGSGVVYERYRRIGGDELRAGG